MRSVAWLCRLGLITMAAALLFGAVFVAIAPRMWGVVNSWEGQPVALETFQPLARRTEVFDRDGNRIAVFQRQNSQPVTFGEIPQHVIDAFLEVEDREFYSHNGVNARSLFRATLSNIASDAAQQGASTITMQVAKNEFLAGLDRDFRYKLLQMHYAMMLEKEYTKDEILERYLNTVFFGNNAYGIQAASEVYFGTTVDQISQVQAIFLAGLVRSPSGYDPIDNPERSRARFTQVIDALVDSGWLTPEAGESAKQFEVPARVFSLSGQQTLPRTYFTEALTDYLLRRSDILGTTFEQREAALYRGGLRIHTTLTPYLQTKAEEAQQVLPLNSKGFSAALVSLETQTGAIVAMVGGRGFVPGENEVNMALAPRQTGSSIKFFILAAALQAGATPDDLIDGRRPCVLPNPGDPSDPFEITNAASREPDTLRAMTWYSINCAYARLSQIVGLNRVVDTTYRMAESAYLYRGQPESDRASLQPYASYATGANEMSPLDMAAGAQTVANEGVHNEPYYVDYIDSWDGERVYEHREQDIPVLDRGVALTTVDVMKGVLTNGTARNWGLDGIPAAGKTGTQAENTNAWFVGFTRNLTTAVWIGDPDGYTPMQGVPEFEGANENNVQGGRYPAQIWNTYMQPAHQFMSTSDWEAPPPPNRPAGRLYLPGNECLSYVVGYVPEAATPSGFFAAAASDRVASPEQPPPPTTVPAATAAPGPAAPPPGPPATPPPPVMVPVTAQYDGGTTIPPDILDPSWPVPIAPLDYRVRPC